MNEPDPDVFARFVGRFAAIEAEVKDPPPDGVGRGAVSGTRGDRRPLAIAAGVVAIVLATVALGPLVAGPTTTGPTTTGSTVTASIALPTSVATEGPTRDPTAASSPMVVCRRLDPQVCETAIGLVRRGHAGDVAAAWAIVVDDVCAPTVICDRLYPFDSVVVLVPPPGSSADPRPFLVVGKSYLPERVEEGWSGPIPGHILAMIQTLSSAPRVIVGQWWASCIDVGSDTCQGVAALAINNLGRGHPSGNLLVRSRRACPVVPTWADGSRCWQADLSVGTGNVCMVIAKRNSDGQYAQVAGDVPGRAHLPTDPVGCPPGD
jgi:hypothetical protein